MQPYPRAPDLVWPGHLHGTGCLSARAMDTGFPIVVWRLCLGPDCAWVWVSVTPPALAGVLGGCVWVRFVVSPLFSRLGFAVFAVGLGFRPAPHHSWLGFWDLRGCVRAPPVPRRSRFCCAVWACVLGSRFRLRPATPWGGVGVCVCACVLVRRGLLHLLVGRAVQRCVVGPWLLPRPATPGWVLRRVCVCVRAPLVPRLSWLGCAVWACVLGSGFGCTPPLLVGLLGCVCGRSCAPLSPRPSWRAACGAGVYGCCRGWGLPPPSPLVFFWGGGRQDVLFLGFVVSVAGCPSVGSRGLRPPIPSLSGCVVCFFFFFRPSVVCVRVLWVSLLPVGRCPRLGVAGFGWVVLRCPFGGSRLRCHLGGEFGRLLWCWWAVRWLWAVLAPPPFFLGGGGLPVPPSAFPGPAHALVGIQCGLPGCCWWWRFARPCPGPTGRVDYVHVGFGAPTCRVRFWLCRLGGCARRLRVALGAWFRFPFQCPSGTSRHSLVG